MKNSVAKTRILFVKKQILSPGKAGLQNDQDKKPQTVKLVSKKALIIIVAFFLMTFFLTRGGGDPNLIKLSQVEEKTIESTITASGIVKSEEEVNLRFANPGRINLVYVEEADYVFRGQPIVSQDPEAFEIALRQAQQDVASADSVLSQVYDEQKKQTQAENFDQKIRRTNAEAAKNKAFDNLKLTEKNLKETTLYAPISGTITAFSVNIKEEVLPQVDIAKIANLKKLEFVAEVDETEISKVKLGQKAAITLDAFPNEQIEATVAKISSQALITQTGATAFEVTFKIPTSENYRLGMNAEAVITIDEVTNALVVPQEAIIDEKYIFIRRDGQYQRSEITTGITSESDVQVISGANYEETVVTSGFEELTKKSLLSRIISFLDFKR